VDNPAVKILRVATPGAGGVPLQLVGKNLRLRIHEHGRRQPRVACGVSPLFPFLAEEVSQMVVIAAAAAALYGSRPRTAPGPSEDLLAQEERARKAVNAAKVVLSLAAEPDISEARQALRERLDELAQVESQISDAKMDVESYPVPEYLQDDFRKSNIMIAVTGASGVGKSSWINAVRRMRPRDAGAAKVGVTETTAIPEVFPFPKQEGKVKRAWRRLKDKFFGSTNNESSCDEAIQVGDMVLVRGHGDAKVVKVNAPGSWTVELQSGEVLPHVAGQDIIGVLAQCVMWDLPGVGTPKFPQDTYLRTFGIRYFDVVVIMTATRFTEAELMLVEELKYWRIPHFLVRNKTDEDVQSEIDREEELIEDDISVEAKKRIEHETIQTVKDYFLTQFGLDRVYCVSTKMRNLGLYDFANLERDINEAVRVQRKAAQITIV